MAVFTLAALAAQIIVLRYDHELSRRHRYDRIMLHLWFALCAFVGAQMGWALRPFLGAPNALVSFFRQEPFTNAYVVVGRLVFGAW